MKRNAVHSSKAVSFIEFALAIPVIMMLILGIIDLFTYIYLSNVLEARAYRALEVASWAPNLEKTYITDSTSPSAPKNAEVTKSIDKIQDAAFKGEISSLFSTGDSGDSRAKLTAEETLLKEVNLDEADYDLDENLSNKMVIVLPKVDKAKKSRSIGFAKQPIGIRINAQLQPLTPFIPPIIIKGEAWGFRENFVSKEKKLLFDCLGNSYNPNRIPTNEECDCIVNRDTGKCEPCPPGTVWGKRPGTTFEGCICNVTYSGPGAFLGDATITKADGTTETCSSSQEVDYINCKCGKLCEGVYNEHQGQTRLDNNSCGCELSSEKYLPNPTPGCEPGDTSKCTHLNCVPPMTDDFKDANVGLPLWQLQNKWLYEENGGWRWNNLYCGCTFCSWWGIVLNPETPGGPYRMSYIPGGSASKIYTVEEFLNLKTDGVPPPGTPPPPKSFDPAARGDESRCSCYVNGELAAGNPAPPARGLMAKGCLCLDGDGNPLPNVEPGTGKLLNVSTCTYDCGMESYILFPGKLEYNDADSKCSCNSESMGVSWDNYGTYGNKKLMGCCPIIPSGVDRTVCQQGEELVIRDGTRGRTQGSAGGSCLGGRCCVCDCARDYFRDVDGECIRMSDGVSQEGAEVQATPLPTPDPIKLPVEISTPKP